MPPMIVRLLALSVFALVVVTFGASPADRVLEIRTADYREDAAVARPVAAVRAVLRARGDEVRVEVEVAAIGPGVEPLPGVEGAPGANLRTAEELHLLLQDGQLAMATRGDDGVRHGRLLRVERGQVPVRRLRGASLIEVRLVTGRRNQIRLQARLRGHTLVGEQRYVYGPDDLRSIPFPRQALHAHRLSFLHPMTQQPMTFEAPLPPDMVELIDRLRI
mgnify:CR=1 FL=1